jgi:desulfoferrodoxin-like iron-binding protein
MTSLQEIYRCKVCGNIVEVLHTGGELVCGYEPMVLHIKLFALKNLFTRAMSLS